ncbi:MAG: hypothetical protein OXH01_09965 [Bacteroidetes bacterium]|nr:hypothetical protein [Bacteroidota bacterium]
MSTKTKPRVAEVVVSGHTLCGSIREAGERVVIDDDSVSIPSRKEQVRRWGMVRVRLVDPDGVREVKPRSWSELSAQELSNVVAGFSDGELAEFRVWAHKAAEDGNEAAATVLSVLG